MTNGSRYFLLGAFVFVLFGSSESRAACLNKQLSDAMWEKAKISPHREASTIREYVLSRLAADRKTALGAAAFSNPSSIESQKLKSDSERLGSYLDQIESGNDAIQQQVIARISKEFDSKRARYSDFITRILAECKDGRL